MNCTFAEPRFDVPLEPVTSNDRLLPTTLAGFRGFHEGQTIVVCGCGTSLNELVDPGHWITIGVNDVGRMFQPDYLVVLNPREQFRGDRFRFVEQSRAKAVFTQLNLRLPNSRMVQFRLGKFGGVDFSDPNCLHYTRNSPYLALCLAIHMGAKRIGLIGVDFTNDHFFGKTGQHPLARQFAQIDQEYKRLYEAASRLGIELFNLSNCSRLTALPKISVEELDSGTPGVPVAAALRGRRIFFVDYKFLSCGNVFGNGLTSAARELNLESELAQWDDPALLKKVRRFAPDLIFVVHGRRFTQKWGSTFRDFRSAVWLLDEPYEVDDTARFSQSFDQVFINDTATLHRHGKAHYLPVCYDPHQHFTQLTPERKHAVGFVGGFNPRREEVLCAVAERGLLSYVVGGPWRSPVLRALTLSANMPPEQIAALYRDTRIVINIFRSQHHFNRQAVAATALNPRIYEAIACGATVLSEPRPEITQICPDLPVFHSLDELITLLDKLLTDPNRCRELLDACRGSLSSSTFASRLREVLQVMFPADVQPAPLTVDRPLEISWKGTSQMPASSKAPGSVPTYSILMVVHNARAMTQLATLRTLQHIHGQDARLVVVDNASNDGIEKWLQILSQRGDIDLISSPRNLGHGPALELARHHSQSPYLVTLDSDAFPLSDDWLLRLRERLSEKVKIAGIRHHRDYIHPSCLMVERKTLDQFGLTFLDEKGRPSRFDVAERISHVIKDRGFHISGLEQTCSLRPGSVSEPIDLGAEYSGIVHHQWYTTRATLSPVDHVDDVPKIAIERSKQELLDKHDTAPRDLAVIIGLRAQAGAHDRLRNAKSCLQALNLQTLERWRYRIIAVEQDCEPHLEAAFAPLIDRYLFAYNPGPYNRGWGFNLGACAATAGKALCLIDADLLVGPTFLRSCLERFEAGHRALRPYREIVYLDAASTEQAIHARLADPMGPLSTEQYRGCLFQESVGGCIWVHPDLYRKLNGHDERFRGWGDEDFDFWRRLLAEVGEVEKVPGQLAHLDHPRPEMGDAWATGNRQLRQQLVAQRALLWTGPIGNRNRYAAEKPGAVSLSPVGRREWENWHRWGKERINSIVNEETSRPAQTSIRWHIAQLVRSLGQSLLDVGCGPGALWSRLESYRDSFTWVGIDATQEMLDVAYKRFPYVRILHGDSASLPLDAESFDVVLLRHVLEHLPPSLMESSLGEAVRVAKKALVLAFHLPPHVDNRSTQQIGGNFLQTRWTEADIKAPLMKAGWVLYARFNISGAENERDDVWVLLPAKHELFPPDTSACPGPKVSIIMPTFRRPHTILRTLQTVRAQTYSNWEVILVDNAGDADYRFADPRIRVFKHAERCSASYARNCGLSHATGDFVCFFDDDDDMLPNYVERFVSTFQANPNLKLVRCGMTTAKGQINFSYATPECCLRREYASATWTNHNFVQDQTYFSGLVRAQGWSAERGDIVILQEALCRANSDPQGGLRGGHL